MTKQIIPAYYNPLWEYPPWFWSLVEDSVADAGLWVLAAWLALAIGGRRQAERSWIDRLGRVVGFGWLLMLAFSILAPTL